MITDKQLIIAETGFFVIALINSYYICNTDEPYANEVLEVILKAESEPQESEDKG